MKLPRQTRKKARIEMLPLIDIVFLLLVFFIYAMLSMAVHRGLAVDLPQSDSAALVKEELLAITIRADNSIQVDQQPVTREELSTLLASRASRDPDQAVLLFADKAVPYDRLFFVLDQLQQAGLTRISMQAEAAVEGK